MAEHPPTPKALARKKRAAAALKANLKRRKDAAAEAQADAPKDKAQKTDT